VVGRVAKNALLAEEEDAAGKKVVLLVDAILGCVDFHSHFSFFKISPRPKEYTSHRPMLAYPAGRC
jgi:hypothetical protein